MSGKNFSVQFFLRKPKNSMPLVRRPATSFRELQYERQEQQHRLNGLYQLEYHKDKTKQEYAVKAMETMKMKKIIIAGLEEKK